VGGFLHLTYCSVLSSSISEGSAHETPNVVGAVTIARHSTSSKSTVKYDRKARRNDDAYVERVVQEVVQAELAKREEGRQSIRAISWCRASRRSCEVKMEKELTRAGSVSSSAGAASGASSTRR
jgi:hypothetical protein